MFNISTALPYGVRLHRAIPADVMEVTSCPICRPDQQNRRDPKSFEVALPRSIVDSRADCLDLAVCASAHKSTERRHATTPRRELLHLALVARALASMPGPAWAQ